MVWGFWFSWKEAKAEGFGFIGSVGVHWALKVQEVLVIGGPSVGGDVHPHPLHVRLWGVGFGVWGVSENLRVGKRPQKDR